MSLSTRKDQKFSVLFGNCLVSISSALEGVAYFPTAMFGWEHFLSARVGRRVMLLLQVYVFGASSTSWNSFVPGTMYYSTAQFTRLNYLTVYHKYPIPLPLSPITRNWNYLYELTVVWLTSIVNASVNKVEQFIVCLDHCTWPRCLYIAATANDRKDLWLVPNQKGLGTLIAKSK